MKRLVHRFQQHSNFFEYSIRSIFTYKTRTIAITGSLAIAIMVLGSTIFLSDGLLKEAQLSVEYAPDITVQNMQAGRVVPMSYTYAEYFSRFLDVKRIVPRVWGYVFLEDSIYTLMGIDPSATPTIEEMGLTVASGRFFLPNEKNVAIIGSHVADNLNIQLNDEVRIAEVHAFYSFTVIGIFDSDISLFTSDLILVDMETSRDFLNVPPETVTDLCIYLDDEAKIPSTASVISEVYPDLRVITRESMKDAVASTYGIRSGYVSVLWYVLLISVILVAWNQASSASREAQREVGILKALGFSTSNILEIRFLETLILGFISASIGVFLAIFYDLYLGAPIIRNFMLGWSAIYPDFPVPIYIGFGSLLTLYAAAIVPLLVGTLIPAWKSAITEPDLVMRGS
ncbi:MAG: ABC transporter permease [Candidatus Bathyarchaeota archaeon]|nr:MAG: ABC transporter permease [Candidatus Bathyarchaeota archaeon]